MASNSFSKGCHDGSVVSIAELRELDRLEWLVLEGEVTVAGIMDWGCWVDEECLWPKRPPRRL